MTDVFKNFQKASFRGIEFPVANAEIGFSHESAEHKYIFRDDSLIEPLGRRNLTFRYDIPFAENFPRGEWSNLYTSVFGEFLNACRNKKPGVLETNDIGAFRAVCASFSYTIDPASFRSGVMVRVEFVHAPEASDIEAEIAFGSLASVENIAGALDRAVQAVGWKEEEPPEPFRDPISSITAAADSINRQSDRVASKFDQISDRLDRMNKSLNRVADVKNWSVFRANQRLQDALIRTKKEHEARQRKIAEFANDAPRMAGDIAAQHGMTLAELLRLNPRLPLPEVPPGFPLRVFNA